MIDAPDLDTALARSLNVQGLLPVETLRALLERSRAVRSGGPSLARLLVEEGLLPEDRVRALLRPLREPPRRPAALNSGAWKEGASIGAYAIEGKLGQGGMGVVHRARHRETGAAYAIKSVAASTPEELQRFLRETKAMATVDGHPNIARVHASGVEGGRAYLVMELARGGDLQVRLKQGPLAPRAAAELTRDLALGVEHLHRRGVLHRDIKPSNILFDEQGSPKLVDFGLARLAQQESLTKTGELLGTPSHMAPEQALGDRAAIDERTDVYGLGALLYHCLTGRPPSGGGNLLAILNAVVHKVPQPPSAASPEVDPRLDRIVLAALQKDPRDRFPSAAAFAAELESYLRGEPETRRAPRRPRGAVATLAGLGLGGLGLLLLNASSSSPPSATPTTDPTRPPAPVTAVDSASTAPLGSVDWPTWRLAYTGAHAARHRARIAYYAPDRELVMFGGRGRVAIRNDLIAWDPQARDWRPRSRGASTTADVLPARGRTEFGLAFHATRNSLILAGGIQRRNGRPLGVREWRQGEWDLPHRGLPRLPRPVWGHELAYDAASARLYLFGGRTTKGLSDQLLVFDGQAWTPVRQSGKWPPPREQFAMAFDPETQRLVVFGGLGRKANAPKVLDDLWTFDGRTWTQHSKRPRHPSARRGASLVYLERGYLVLYGGSPHPTEGPGLPDLWFLTGTDWTVRHFAGLPPPRWAAGVAWDPARKVLLVAGGWGTQDGSSSPSQLLETTWELHGLEVTVRLADRVIRRLRPKEERRRHLQRPGDWVAEARSHLGSSPKELVIEYCNEALRLLEPGARKPLRGAIHLLRGRAYQAAGQNRRARAEFDRALAEAPDLIEAYAQRSLVLAQEKNHVGAIRDLDYFLARLPRPELLYRRGASLSALNRHDEAILDFERVLANSDPEESHHQLAKKALLRSRKARR